MSQESPWASSARPPLTSGQVAVLFGVKPPTVLRWRAAGVLPALSRRPVRRGAWLFDPAVVDELLAKGAPAEDPGEPSVADIEAIIASEFRKPARRAT